MTGEVLLNVSQINNIRFKVETNQATYIYITLDKFSNPAYLKSLSNTVYVGEIINIKDDGKCFIITTDSGQNIIELEADTSDWGYFMLFDKY